MKLSGSMAFKPSYTTKVSSLEVAMNKNLVILSLSAFYIILIITSLFFSGCSAKQEVAMVAPEPEPVSETKDAEVVKGLDTADYNQRMLKLANGDSSGRWPVKTVYPLPGAILPFYRVVSYYGNLYSKNMGILGQLPKEDMLAKLAQECEKWAEADTSTTVLPALHYIAATAQRLPGRGSMYRLRMPDSEIDRVIEWSREIKALTFLDIQTGHSTVKSEVAALGKYLQMPDVHLGIDPEYGMKNGGVPGTSIGTFDAVDVNDAINFLASLVRQHNLPPKILVVHRFTQGMVTNYKKIKIVPEVQVVIDMDGFGRKVLKLDSYRAFIYREPVQFAGFKLFYKNDKPMYTPRELMKMVPVPIYIQYQ